MSIEIQLKPSYEVPLIGVVGAGAQTAFISGRITPPFRINGAIIIFDTDHIDNVLHYLLTDETDNISTASISTGDNILPPRTNTPYFIGHNTIRRIKIIREYPEGDLYLKCHVVNNNAYQIQVNASIIIEEL